MLTGNSTSTIEQSPPTAQEWQQHYENWQASSQSKSAYCRRHGLSLDNFYYHSRRLEKEKATKSKGRGFVEVVSQPLTTIKQVPVKIMLANQTQLSLELSECRLIDLIRELSHAAAVIR